MFLGIASFPQVDLGLRVAAPLMAKSSLRLELTMDNDPPQGPLDHADDRLGVTEFEDWTTQILGCEELNIQDLGSKVQGIPKSIRNLVTYHTQIKIRFDTRITNGLRT